MLYRRGFAGQRGFVENGRRAAHDAVDRDGFAGANHQAIARLDVFDRHGVEPVAAAALSGARNPAEQCFHFPLRRALRVTFKRFAASEHHRDHDSGKVFAAGERAAHRQSGDEIKSNFPPPEACRARFDKGQQDRRDADCPGKTRQIGPAAKPERDANRERRGGKHDEISRGH
jgi:hypothetical protein